MTMRYLIAAALLCSASSALAQTPDPKALALPTGAVLNQAIADADARLFWAVFEGCDPEALDDLLLPNYRMLHDKEGLAIASRTDFVASQQKRCAARKAGGSDAGYKNRRQLVPGSRTLRPLGNWGVLEEASHVFSEWNAKAARWDMVGGARYMHVWQWMPTERRFRLSESLSYDHGAADAYPPVSASAGAAR